MSIWQNQFDMRLGADTAIGAVLGDEPAGLGIDFLSQKTIVRDYTGAYVFEDLFNYADQTALAVAWPTILEPGGGVTVAGNGTVQILGLSGLTYISRQVSLPVGIYDIYVDIISENTVTAAAAAVRVGTSPTGTTYNFGLLTANPGIWQFVASVPFIDTLYLTIACNVNPLGMTLGGIRLVRKDAGINGISTVPSLLTYGTPSPKYVGNGFGVLESASTLRCDHDITSIDTSTTALSSADIDNAMPVRKTLTTANAYAYAAGQDVRLTDAADISKWMLGRVVSFSSGTLLLDAYEKSGDFSASSWKVIVAKGLLVENARTNSFLWSQDFSNAAWVKVGCTITADNVVAPDGTMTADTVVYGSTASVKQTAASALNANAFSIWMKSATPTTVTLTIQSTGTSPGTVTRSVNLTSVWQPYQIGMYVTGSLVGIEAGVQGITQNIHVWGGQLEAIPAGVGLNTLATSYIPTTTAAVTRNADFVSILTSALPWVQQGTSVVVDFTPTFTDRETLQFYPTYLLGGANHYMYFVLDTGSAQGTGAPSFRLRAGGSVTSINGPADSAGVSGQRWRWAAGYNSTTFRAASNGVKVGSDTAISPQPVIISVWFGNNNTGTAGAINGHVHRASIVPRLKSDAQLVIDTGG